ncbi:MAG: hybrid sensor histidine kinase/response regulator [Bdellovibrionota bacterium]|nr:hybrid sensor histidine kinase/response regulator [Bdellovibrionota bacterium]
MRIELARPPRILIADDTQKNVQVIGTVLRREGYQINVASSGEQAIELANKITPDLVLLDIMMPGGDGIETCQKLKKMKELEKVPILFISAKSELEDVLRGFQVGGSDYIPKPFNSQELVARVKTHLENKLYGELIEKQNAERQELIHILCHDLSNPVVGIIGILELLDEVKTLEEAKKFFNYLKIGADNAFGIIEMIRKIQLLDERQNSLTLKRVNLLEVFRECLNIIYLRAKKKNIKINLDVDEGHYVIVEKTSFINSVLINLLTNSLKFSDSGSSIEVSSSIENDKVKIKITDFGIGMSEKLLENIFDMSEETSRRGTEGETGTGYGMPLVRKFINQYGGKLLIKSSEEQEDHGTVVTIELPFEES